MPEPPPQFQLDVTPSGLSESTNGIPIDIFLQIGRDQGSSNRKRDRLADINSHTITNKLEAIRKVLNSLAPNYDLSGSHQCHIEYESQTGMVKSPCSNAKALELAIAEYQRKNGSNLRFYAKYNSVVQRRPSKTASELLSDLLKSKTTKNYDNQSCVLPNAVRSILFEADNMLSRLSMEDAGLGTLIEDQSVLNEIKANGVCLLATLCLAKQQTSCDDTLGELFFGFWDDQHRDSTMPFDRETQPCYCNEATWYQIIGIQNRLSVVELMSLKQARHFSRFAESQPLPFSKKTLISSGGCGEVSEIELIGGHQELYRVVWKKNGKEYEKVNPPLALKRLLSYHGDATEGFKRETSMLVRLNQMQHRHIIHLITAFAHGPHHYLVFPLAKYSLETHFAKTQPARTISHIVWLLEQFIGITDALDVIHGQMIGSSKPLLDPTRQPHHFGHQQQPGLLGVPAPAKNPSLRDLETGLTGEKLKGYHNDLALNNLLVFSTLHEYLEGNEAKYGRIVISDFGLGKLRRPVDGSKTRHISGQFKYLAPESRADKLEERYQDKMKDIWGLGCILLEVLVWLRGGPSALPDFDSRRSGLADTSCTDISDQGFWTYSKLKSYELRPAVKEEMESLPKFSKWLSKSERNKEKYVQEAVTSIIGLVRDCFNFIATARPGAGDVSKRLQNIRDALTAAR